MQNSYRASDSRCSARVPLVPQREYLLCFYLVKTGFDPVISSLGTRMICMIPCHRVIETHFGRVFLCVCFVCVYFPSFQKRTNVVLKRSKSLLLGPSGGYFLSKENEL